MDKDKLLVRLLKLIEEQHNKLDAATLSPEIKAKNEGHLEALYQVESLVLNWNPYAQ